MKLNKILLQSFFLLTLFSHNAYSQQCSGLQIEMGCKDARAGYGEKSTYSCVCPSLTESPNQQNVGGNEFDNSQQAPFEDCHSRSYADWDANSPNGKYCRSILSPSYAGPKAESTNQDSKSLPKTLGSGEINERGFADAEAENIVRACKEQFEEAATACGFAGFEMQMAMMGVQGLAQGIASGSGSMRTKCEAAKKISEVSAAVNGGLGAWCMTSATQCTNECKEISAKYIKQRTDATNEMRGISNIYNNGGREENGSYFVKEYDAEKRKQKIAEAVINKTAPMETQCRMLRTKSAPMLIQAVANAGATLATGSCSQYADSSTGSLSEFCARSENKNTSVCLAAASCADPIKARQDPLCLGGGTAGAGGTLGGVAGNGGINKAGIGAGGNPLDDLKKPFGKVGADGPGTQTRNEGIGGGSSGGPQAGNAAGLNPEENGGAAPEYNTNVDQGYQRSKGGLGEGGGSMFGASRGGYLGNGGAEKKPGFDLSKYMPWMNKKGGPDRQIAEIDKLKADGVTGAGGPSIWEKVSNRMRAIRPRLE
ncbi:MAG: hypothetical protein A4S09_05555 [Proteobacteria bacterium SG_bin7]|nr:MAG: hypothetical protein A4S09_05555 [Proteobacteria bacterium SG_bin7]